MAAARVKAEAQLVDVLPTVLDLAGFAAPATAQGISLRPALEGKELPSRTVYAQTLSLKTAAPYVGIRKYPWKLLLEEGRYELFDLASDPAEQHDVAPGHPEELKAMKAELDRMVKGIPLRRTEPEHRPLAAVAERMKALGYWWMDRPRVELGR